ncbi:MAG: gamma-D-glutamyl-meso-diaminopimelate peptidase [Candidatus Paraimprobicoccus trichonymphae]|uniref:Gamma-D-glutamyl-meso-diaminopimelate peptidase n=1 Tax=Candidatus Paraimprobicoccus trichonymphae TaxID=3033793 RepID=A0AA48KXQ1_9FIRM|nr:MAG: gamma-D-glutamyl-meso-diaminopimelate peptidase [Candidatus Paraimprobicoccus trichonymphae]
MFDFNRNPDESFRNEFKNYMKNNYCDILKIVNLSQSLCGRNIEIYQLGNTKNSVLYVASFHGAEWITSLVIFKFIDEILQKFEIYKNILSLRGITAIPCINPDGVEISLNGYETAKKYRELVKKNLDKKKPKYWQANARGVDLNHNFNAGWQDVHKKERELGIISASNTRYGGEFPESESESKSLADFCRKNFFEYSFAFHSQGEEIYWNYGNITPKKSRFMAEIFSALSGYKISEPIGIAVGGGFKDWFIEIFRRPAFTVEVGKGQNPLNIKEFKGIYKKIKKMLEISICL